MSKTDKTLSEIFDVEYDDTPSSQNLPALPATTGITKSADNTDFVKSTIIRMMAKGEAALEELHLIARDTEKSRDFEVMFNGMKTVVEMGEKLLAAEKENEEPKQTPQTINQNAFFVGSTKELASLLKNGNSSHTDSQSDNS